MIKKTEVIKFIENAFPNRRKDLTKDELQELRRKIVRYEERVVKAILPSILIDVLKESAHDVDGCDCCEMIIYFLDGLKEKKRNLQEKRFYQQFADSSFSEFNEKQNQAVLLWLETISGMRFLEACMNDYHSALKYWRNQMKSL